MDKISKEDIISAIKEIDSNPELRKGRASSTYDLIYEGLDYPPKLVISIANKIATGEQLNPNDFEGGIGTPAFKLLEDFGFEIQKKIDPIKLLIEDYKKHIEATQLSGEVYKWELINEFKGRPNTDAVDFYQEVKSIKFKNLVYAMGIAVLNDLTEVKPEEMRVLFKNLFNENIVLSDRIISFNVDSLKIYRDLGRTLQHHQDERSIATYLTYHNNEKYTLYKSSFYKKYCQLLGIKEAKKNEKYVHYLQLINELIENYIKLDAELINQVKNLIPEYYDGKNHNLLAQDILYQMLEKEKEINYWIFQGNPKFYDIIGALQNEVLTTWKVAAHKDKIKIGDKVILWLSGDNAGCYALAKVTSEVGKIEMNPDEIQYYKAEYDENEDRVSMEIEHNLADDPILWEENKGLTELVELKVGNQGTNFTATEQEYNTIKNFISSDYDNFEKVLQKFNQEELKKYFTQLFEILDTANLEKGDSRMLFSYNNRKLSFSVGQRIALIIRNKSARGKFLILTKGKLNESSLPFGATPPVLYTSNIDNLELKNNQKKAVFEGIEYELNRVKSSGYRNKNYNDFESAVFDPIFRARFQQQNNKIMSKETNLNQILFGPPGTGKTYRLQKEYFDKFTIKETALSRDQYLDSLIGDLSWWQTISIAVLDLGSAKVNEIHEHEFIRVKEKLSSSKNVKPTIWSSLQSHTVMDCPNVNVTVRMDPLFFNKSDDSKWTIDKELLETLYPEAFEILEKSKNFSPDTNKLIKNYEFITFHQSFSYEDFIEGIKPKLDDSEKDVSFEIKDGVFKKLCLKAEADPTNDYAIFIDEINRGNVSAIFGELITLIENDKRIGGANEIKVRLPYSKSEFGVPSNLFIIGTMNTADRSVEALDTALRRRFSFTEIMPDSTLLDKIEFNGFTLAEVLGTINQRIEVLLDRDHTIGHSYFLKLESGDVEGLKSVFTNNIIPLLQEYFYHDYEKIALILGEGFIKIKENKTVKFANFKNIDSPEIANQFELISSIDNIENAIIPLLNN
jgi:hypothetical protein